MEIFLFIINFFLQSMIIKQITENWNVCERALRKDVVGWVDERIKLRKEQRDIMKKINKFI